MPGFDRSRFVAVPDHELDEFTCGICLSIFKHPLTTECCRQTYCEECIKGCVSLNSTCPNDRKILTNNDLKPVPRLLVNLLDGMRIKCDYELDGCPEAVRVGELAQHLTVCECRPNQLCKTCGVIKESLLSHNCIQSLIAEKSIFEENNRKLFQQNSSLLFMCREKDEIILSFQQAQIRLNQAIDDQRREFIKKDNLIGELRKKITQLLKIVNKQEQTSDIPVITNKVIMMKDNEKYNNLLELLKENESRVPNDKCIMVIVTSTSHNDLTNFLSKRGFNVNCLLTNGTIAHKSHSKRDNDNPNTQGQLSIFVSTLACAVIKVGNVDNVINFDFPKNIRDYIMTISLLKRNIGKVTSFLTLKNMNVAPDLYEYLLKDKQEIPDWLQDYITSHPDHSEEKNKVLEAIGYWPDDE